jgi:hypothetical protein
MGCWLLTLRVWFSEACRNPNPRGC